MGKHKDTPPLAEWRFGTVGSTREGLPFIGALSFRKDGTLVIHDEDGILTLALALAPGTYIRRCGPAPAVLPEPSADVTARNGDYSEAAR